MSDTEGSVSQPSRKEGLRGLSHQRAAEAWLQVRHSARWARWHQLAHYGIGIASVVAGTVAGVSGLAEERPTLTGIAAFVAAAGAALTTFLNEKKTADAHWRRAAGFRALAHEYEALTENHREPTREEFKELTTRWEVLDQPWEK
jgi:hypothetical protein